MAASSDLERDESEVAAVKAMVTAMFDRGEGPPSLADMRAGYDAWGLAFPLPEGGAYQRIELGGVPTDKIVLPNSDHATALLYFHGGGYGIGSAKSHRHLVGQLCFASGFVGYNVDYRLAPETVFPGAVDDALAAYGGLLDHGIAPSKIVIAGDSAGGGLTIACALAIKAAGLPQPSGLFVMSPWLLLTQIGQSYETKADVDFICSKAALQDWADAYLAGADPESAAVSPLHSDLTGLAPMLIHVGSDEVLLGDSISLAFYAGMGNVDAKLVVASHMPHVFHYMWAQLSRARAAIVEAGDWMKARVG